MSWQAFVDSNLIGSGKLTNAAIHGHDGNTWATSTSFSVSPAEVQAVVAAFKDASNIRANGLRIANVKVELLNFKYIALKADERSIYGKSGGNGIVCVKTKQSVLLGTFDNSVVQPGDAGLVLDALADYLINSGY